MKTVSFLTLGCKVNQYDTDAMRGLFLARGYRPVETTERADVCVINTCSVTHIGERKSRQAIRRAKRLNPETLIVVAGCYAQLNPEEIAGIEGVNLIIGTQDRRHIVDFVESYQSGSGVQSKVRDILGVRDFENLNLYGEALEHTRAYVKIQEGCDNYCTFCIIPYTRGRLKSRRPEEIYREANYLAAHGYKEIVLTGIHLGNYGKDLGDGIDLTEIVRHLLATTTIPRIRLGSIESVELSAELIAMLATEERLCMHLHLPLQSGSDAVLQRMRRHYRLDAYRRLLRDIRRQVPDVAITTDLIVGFPGETEEMFAETLATLREFGFAAVHVFPYSPRAGTPAASFPEQVPEAVKKERVHAAEAVAAETGQRYRERFVGRTLAVLTERQREDGLYEGLTEHYCRVLIRGNVSHTGALWPVRITAAADGVLQGTYVEEEQV